MSVFLFSGHSAEHESISTSPLPFLSNIILTKYWFDITCDFSFYLFYFLDSVQSMTIIQVLFLVKIIFFH